MNQPRRGDVHVSGVKLSYLEWGSAREGAPSLLCLHGLLATGESFARLAAHLPAAEHIIALDLPGNGGSETRRELDASFAGLADVVEAFAGVLGLRRLVVIGHSHGGALALRLACSRPGFFAGAVLLCPAHPFSGQEMSLVRFYLSGPGRLFAHTIPYLPAWMLRVGFRRMLGSAYRGDESWLALYERNLRRPGVISHVLRMLKSWREDMDSLRRDLRLKNVAMPVRLIWGGDDPVVPAATGRRLEAVLGDAETVVLAGVGHLPNEEDPERCGALIADWMARLR